MVLLVGFADVAEYIGEYRQQVRRMYIANKLPKPYTFTYKDNIPVWKESQIKEWVMDLYKDS